MADVPDFGKMNKSALVKECEERGIDPANLSVKDLKRKLVEETSHKKSDKKPKKAAADNEDAYEKTIYGEIIERPYEKRNGDIIYYQHLCFSDANNKEAFSILQKSAMWKHSGKSSKPLERADKDSTARALPYLLSCKINKGAEATCDLLIDLQQHLWTPAHSGSLDSLAAKLAKDVNMNVVILNASELTPMHATITVTELENPDKTTFVRAEMSGDSPAPHHHPSHTCSLRSLCSHAGTNVRVVHSALRADKIPEMGSSGIGSPDMMNHAVGTTRACDVTTLRTALSKRLDAVDNLDVDIIS